MKTIFTIAFLLPVLESKFVQFGYFGYPDNDVLSIIFDVPSFIFLVCINACAIRMSGDGTGSHGAVKCSPIHASSSE
mgnify:CR=1 FL=1